jgi:endo-1,4-beta-xylanase
VLSGGAGLYRRSLVQIAGLTLPTLAHQGRAESGMVPSIRAVAETAGLRYGSDSDVEIRTAPPAYAALLRQHCAVFAPNLPWSYLAPHPDDLEAGGMDRNIEFALAQAMQLTGAHFLWHQRVPAWFEDLDSRQAAERAAIRHVSALGSRFAGQVYSWNVVNEAINPREGRPDGLRRSQILRQLGPDFFEPAFHAARAADPNALLIYNDYDMEMDSKAHADRRRALLDLLDRLLARSVPIDGVGLQSHVRLGGGRFDEKLYRGFLSEIAARSLRILITELDVLDLSSGGTLAERDANIAGMYSALLRPALDEPATKAVVTWGLSDRYTWLSTRGGPNTARTDGDPIRPLPFDDAFRPKPAYFAIVDALRAAPRRSRT